MAAEKMGHKGFSLLELMLVLGILSVLSSTSYFYGRDMINRSRDTISLSDAKNLLTIVGNNFAYDDSVDYTAQNGQNIGVADEFGGPRGPVYTLGVGVVIDFAVDAGAYDNKSYEGDAKGSFGAYLYHTNGTSIPADFTGIPYRKVHVVLDERFDFQDFVVW